MFTLSNAQIVTITPSKPIVNGNISSQVIDINVNGISNYVFLNTQGNSTTVIIPNHIVTNFENAYNSYSNSINNTSNQPTTGTTFNGGIYTVPISQSANGAIIFK
jgi:hypothetical protein